MEVRHSQYIRNDLIFLTISRLAGLFPFSEEGKSTNFLTLSSAGVVCLVCPSSLALACYQIVLAYSNEPGSHKKVVGLTFTNLELFKSILFSASLVVHFYVTTKYRSLFEWVIRRMFKFGVRRFGGVEFIFGSALLSLRFACIIYALCTPVNQVDMFVLRSNSIINVMCWMNFLVLFQMISLISTINNHLPIRSERANAYMIDVLQHSQLLETSQKIVFLYGRQLIFIIGQCVYAATTSCYYLMSNLMAGKSVWGSISLHAIDLISFLISSYQLFVLARICEVNKDKVDAFYKELFRLMRESKTLCSNKKLCLYVSMRKTVNFTACGFFNLGYPLITSIIAAATTYLVILVQFSIPK